MKEPKENIALWAEKLAFDQLSEAQKQVVLEEMTMEEYASLHGFLGQVESMEKEKELAQLGSTLMLEFENRQESKKAPIFMMPVKYAAAAVLLLLGGWAFTLWSLQNQEPQVVVETKEVFKTKTVHDTIYVEKEVEVPIYVTKYKEVVRKEEPTRIIPKEMPERLGVADVAATTPDPKDVQRSFGNTTLNPDQVEQFKVSM